jgi:hypothetical protein
MAAASTATARRATAPARTARSRARSEVARPARSRPATRTARPARRRQPTPMPARLVPLAVGRTAGAVSGLADSGLVHRLTRGRLWIGALTTLLVGIVALNVLALSLNASSSKVGMQADSLKRQISALRAEIATNGASNKRIQDAAANLGLIVPEPGAVGYLRHGADDATVAARRLASGELTSQALSVAPVPLSVPATTVAPPASTDAATVAQPATNSTEPATNTTTTTPTTDAAAPPPAPAAGQGAGGAAVGGGGVSTP